MLFPGALLDSCQKVDDEYRELRPSPWSVKAGTTEDMIKNSETQMMHKQKAVLGASGGAIAAPGSANFT